MKRIREKVGIALAMIVLPLIWCVSTVFASTQVNLERNIHFNFTDRPSQIWAGDFCYKKVSGNDIYVINRDGYQVGQFKIKGNGIFITQFNCDGYRFIATSDDASGQLWKWDSTRSYFNLVFDVVKDLPAPPLPEYGGNGGGRLFVRDGKFYCSYTFYHEDYSVEYLLPFYWDEQAKSFGYGEFVKVQS